jgi:hypothetical protein
MHDPESIAAEACTVAALFTAPELLFDLSGVDLAARPLDRAAIERVNPHRGSMSLLDWIVWTASDRSRGVGLRHIRSEPFWDHGGGTTYPEALMIEAGAQMACFMYNSRMAEPKNAAFLRLEDALVIGHARPGDDLYILCADSRFSRRRFVAGVQGVVNGRVVFSGRITGMGI